MNKLLTKAIEAVSRLPDAEQTDVARLILERLEAEDRWDVAFADPRSEALLKQLADEAMAEGSIEGDPSTIPQ